MELNNNELFVKDSSLDLLSAALNESGVTLQDDLDINGNKNEDEDILASLMTTIQPGVNNDRSKSPVIVTKGKPIQKIKNVVTTNRPKIITVGRSGTNSPVGKIITIGKLQPKIIKIPESGKGNLPRIIKIPLNSKINNNNLPILISKKPNSIGAQSVPTVITTTGGIKYKTVRGADNTVIRFQNNNNVVSHLNLSSFEKPEIVKKQLSTSVEKTKPQIFNITNKTTVATVKVNDTTVPSQSNVHKEKDNFNLGSMFVESAEKSSLDRCGLSPSPESLTEMPNFQDFISVPTPSPIVTKPIKYPTALLRQKSVPANLSERDIISKLNYHDQHHTPIRKINVYNQLPKLFQQQNIPLTSEVIAASMRRNSANQPLNKFIKSELNPGTGVTASKFYSKEKEMTKTSGDNGVTYQDMYKNQALEKKPDDLVLAEEQEEDEARHAATYAEYKPSKSNIGLPHPDSVVETSSLASVPPPDIHYKLHIHDETIDRGLLSALQLEAIIYACQRNETFLPCGERAGFLVGDGAGVGKGRTIAGIIFENYLIGRKKAIWFSVSNDLKYDAERDLRDIGAKNIKVHALNKFKYGKITSKENGNVKKGVIFSTYSSLIGESHKSSKYGSRLKQILNWCGSDFDGPIIFDECHKAKNLVPSGSNKSTKTGYTVLELQKLLPKARVIYASATGASEPKNMAYMSRLGLWGENTPFKEFHHFIQAVERRGVGAMEMVAMDLKLRGSYMARQLSFHGVSFRIVEVPLPLSFIRMYNACVKLWVSAREAFQLAAQLIEAEYHMKKTMWGQFWSAHQRFFKYLCIASKVNQVSLSAREAVKHGKCVVIGLQSTGEARTLDILEKQGGELDDFVSTAKGVFENLIEKHFPAPNRKRVTALFGQDFYGKKDEAGKLKRKLNNSSTQISPKRSRKSNSSSEDSDSEEEGKVPKFLNDSVDSSDEDIGKIFGSNSESEEEWGSSGGGKRKNKSKNKQSSAPKSDDNNSDADEAGILLQMDEFNKSKSNKYTAMEEGDSLSFGGSDISSCLQPRMTSVEKAQALKKFLLDKLERISSSLPNNTLDELIDALGGQENVAEMTGRKGRIVSNDDGSVQYESRSENDVKVDMLNMAEKQRFMDGEKNIAIISEAASSGISLQADRRARNQRKRVHFTLELPWSADKAIQQFGRTHRSNQVHAPEYIFLISELAGEQRFASIVAKRLESLGALTHGDRRATETRDLSQYNFDNKYGRIALESVLKSVLKLEKPLVPTPPAYPGNFLLDIQKAMIGVGLIYMEENGGLQLEKDYSNISKFMNRILGMEVAQQNSLFEFFTASLNYIIKEVKSQGLYDRGIMDLGSSGESVERLNVRKFTVKTVSNSSDQSYNNGYVELHTLKVERGMSWKDAEAMWESCNDDAEGFYITQLKRHGKCMAVLAVEFFNKRWKTQIDRHTNDQDRMFTIYRPSTGKQLKLEKLSMLESKYRKVPANEAEDWWKKQYEASTKQCTHSYWQGMCSRFINGETCNVGKRQRTCHVLSGNVLAVWNVVEHVLSNGSNSSHKMQIIRLKIQSGKLVGLLIPSNCVPALILSLSKSDSSIPLPTIERYLKDESSKNSLSRSFSMPAFAHSKHFMPSSMEVPSPASINTEDREYESDLPESDDDDDISPDDVDLSGLFPNKYSWMS